MFYLQIASPEGMVDLLPVGVHIPTWPEYHCTTGFDVYHGRAVRMIVHNTDTYRNVVGFIESQKSY